jgi:ABC-type lipoprotein export system ATPase subunit
MLIVTHEGAVSRATDRVIYLRDGVIESDERNPNPVIEF